MVRPARFERATFRFGGEYSIQLSYGRKSVGDVTRRGQLESSLGDRGAEKWLNCRQ